MELNAHRVRTATLNAFVFIALCVVFTGATAGNLSVLVLDKDNTPVPNAVVMVVGKNTPAATPSASQSTIYQERMRFSPAISIVPLGGKVQFVNKDPWEHHVRGSAAGSANFNASGTEGFELRLEGKPNGKRPHSAEIAFTKAGAVLLGCHIHATMSGYVYVTDSPWAALTASDGVATLEQIPDGVVQVRVWHPDQLVDIAAQSFTVSPASGKLSLQLSVVPRRRR